MVWFTAHVTIVHHVSVGGIKAFPARGDGALMLWLSISHQKRPAYKRLDVEKKCIGVFNVHINETPNTMKKNTPRLFPIAQGCVLTGHIR